ncbi:MAG: hypothetical protein ACRDSE_08205 [Pseudonocardiaceae bacterium]
MIAAVVSGVLRRHLLTDYGPPAVAWCTGAGRAHDEQQAGADLELAELAQRLDRGDQGQRAAG